jgi:hypothetical protein
VSVVIYRRRPADGAIEVVGRIAVLEPGQPAVVLPSDDRAARSLESLVAGGVPGHDGRRLYLSDGPAFLVALPDAIRGSRLWAEREPG